MSIGLIVGFALGVVADLLRTWLNRSSEDSHWLRQERLRLYAELGRLAWSLNSASTSAQRHPSPEHDRRALDPLLTQLMGSAWELTILSSDGMAASARELWSTAGQMWGRLNIHDWNFGDLDEEEAHQHSVDSIASGILMAEIAEMARSELLQRRHRRTRPLAGRLRDGTLGTSDTDS